MIIKDEKVLDLFRGPGVCEWCMRFRYSRDAAHIFARGLGGGHRLDVLENLVSLCRDCHQVSHAGKSPTRKDMLALVCKREGVTYEQVLATLWKMRNATKSTLTSDGQVQAGSVHPGAEKEETGRSSLPGELPAQREGNRISSLEAPEGWRHFL